MCDAVGTCTLCEIRRDAVDPILLANRAVEWGYPSNADGSAQGNVCRVCMLCFVGHDWAAHRTVAQWLLWMGSTKENASSFKAVRQCPILFSYYVSVQSFMRS